MELVEVIVNKRAEVDGAVVVKADYGPHRVVAEIPRSAIDDYFEPVPLNDRLRVVAIDSNKDAVGALMLRKCEWQEWRDENRFGSTIKRIDICKADLLSGPRLSDARLQMEVKSGNQAVNR